MGNPTPGTRPAPTAWKVDQGYRIVVGNSRDPNINLWEIEVTPSGDEGGDAINTSTQWNDVRHTKRPRALIDGQGGKITAQLAAGTRAELNAILNKEATITEFYPDGSTYCYFGYFKNAKFSSFKEGDKPTVEVEIVETDWDYVNHVESVPVFSPAGGTGTAGGP